MGSFDRVMEFILRWEGGYVNNPNEIRDALDRAVEARTSTLTGTSENPCSVKGCGHPALAKGLCNAHYLRQRNGKDMSKPVRVRKRDGRCSECDAPTNGKGGWGMCPAHYRRERLRLLKSTLVELMGGECQVCHQEYPLPVYDFHHVDRETKEGSPGNLLSNGSLDAIADEISKCVLVCANCHRMIHAL